MKRSSSKQRVQEILERETQIRLNWQQARKVFELIDRPPRPGAALRAAKAAHRKLVRASR